MSNIRSLILKSVYRAVKLTLCPANILHSQLSARSHFHWSSQGRVIGFVQDFVSSFSIQNQVTVESNAIAQLYCCCCTVPGTCLKLSYDPLTFPSSKGHRLSTLDNLGQHRKVFHVFHYTYLRAHHLCFWLVNPPEVMTLFYYMAPTFWSGGDWFFD